ncbi:MAG: hypothetical protein L3K17_05265 [Thermoplasmata archaeon]|nr:hypothetical protein [Thermoplasmata archaeon]
MGAPPGAMQAPPPPPMWMPMPPQAAPAAAHPIPWGMLSLLARFLGFVLLFLGTVFVILGVEPSGNCYTSTACANTGWVAGAANWLIAGKLMWAIGLFFLGAGAGMKIHWKLGWTEGAKPEDLRFMGTERIANYLVIIVCIILLFFLLTSVTLVTSAAGL